MARGQHGTVTMMTLLAFPVLMALLLGATELAMRTYYRAQVHSVATAAALAAVGNQKHHAIPIPNKWVAVGPIIIPVDGFVLNVLTLPDIDSGPTGAVMQVKGLTNPDVKLSSEILPVRGWLPSPFKWVKITASIEPPGVFGKVFEPGPIQESACAIAWIRPDWWWHGWWSDVTPHTLFGINDEPYRYYRLMPCDKWAPGDILEAVAWAHLEATGKNEGSNIKGYWNESDKDPDNQDSREGPKNTDEVDQCAKNPSSCRQQQPYIVQCWDGTTKSIPPTAWKPGDPTSTAAELEAKNCPPKPPPKTDSTPAS